MQPPVGDKYCNRRSHHVSIIAMEKYNLPKGYLSWSAYDLWVHNKNAFRKRYYEGVKMFETPEILYGKSRAKELEDDPTVVGSETYIEVFIDEGLKIMGYLDSFEDTTLSITEYKTAHASPKGKAPWDIKKVNKHGQLVFYQLLVREKFQKFNPLVRLKWFETEVEHPVIIYKGCRLISKKKIKGTGREEVFERIISSEEIDMLRENIIKVAKEITKDYEDYKRNQSLHTTGEVEAPEIYEEDWQEGGIIN